MLIMAKLPFGSGRTGFVWVGRVWNGSADPKSRQMRGAFRHTISQHKRWTSSGNSHSPYSPDLAPSDFLLFLYLKKHLFGKMFDDGDEVKKEVMTWFKVQAADFYDSGIQKLVPRLIKCLNNAGDYFEIYSYVQAVHSQCRFCKLKMLYMFKTFVSLLSGQTSYFIVHSGK